MGIMTKMVDESTLPVKGLFAEWSQRYENIVMNFPLSQWLSKKFNISKREVVWIYTVGLVIFFLITGVHILESMMITVIPSVRTAKALRNQENKDHFLKYWVICSLYMVAHYGLRSVFPFFGTTLATIRFIFFFFINYVKKDMVDRIFDLALRDHLESFDQSVAEADNIVDAISGSVGQIFTFLPFPRNLV